MDVFVTGATGVIGRRAIPELIANGHTVRGLARSERNVEILRELGAEPVHADLFDLASLTKAVAGSQAVLHLATKIPPTATIRKRSAWYETDRIRREGTRNVVDAALAQGVETIIYPGICFVYPDNGPCWVDAASAGTVICDYYKTTFDAEAEVRRFTDAGGRGITLRLGYLYGPESQQSHDQIRFARMGLATVPGRADAYHPFLAIEDAGRAVAAALEHAPAGVYDITEDEPPTTAQMSAAMAKAVGRRSLYALPAFLSRAMMGELFDAMSRSQRVSNRRFKEATGWAPQVSVLCDGWERVARAAKG